MDRGRRLLLQYAIEDWEPVVHLATTTAEDNFAHWQHHGLERSDLADALDAMFQDGDIVALWGDEPKFVATRQRIERALGARNRHDNAGFYYGLTAQGGRRWEEATRPDWSRYISSRHSSPNVETACADLSRLRKYLDSRPYKILSPHWQVLAPWQATYWKQLPQGHLVRYSLEKPGKRGFVSAISAEGESENESGWWKWFESPA